MDFDMVFYHEMTHVVMNDAVGGEASVKIPHWAQEGLGDAIFPEKATAGSSKRRNTFTARK